MEGCVYCGGPIEDPSPEHVIPRLGMSTRVGPTLML